MFGEQINFGLDRVELNFDDLRYLEIEVNASVGSSLEVQTEVLMIRT